ncbi:Gfo/Idh/MocA family oxidoreductase [Curtobacterium pusillum]|uniref:Gfo/Idh/MocA family oxidoreductase n=1 Tax=Curtobacterium pusillum TaxID=69373 RepID=A0ABX2MD54_9MICO|nr:Gfo/Idh/MocA family oxidoreductase [Curtobacterium pusillum]NUU15493.1 Gfo/Idh/MocA family oxidoreductase [Curtobacterium pusillum]GLK32788.1 dehydrogenase [Curtobacterium pusillum]
MTDLKVGVMSFAHTHAIGYLAALAEMPGVEVRGSDPGGVSTGESLVELRGRDLADELGVSYLESYDELLAWRPDAVVVTSENARHRELVEAAAAAGAHILCEKPLATTWEDGIAIRDAVEAAGVMLMIAFPVRFASAFGKLRAAHDSGSLGQLYAIRGANNGMLPITRSWFTEPELSGGGAIVDHVVHIADMLEGLMGSAPVAVTAVANGTLHAARAQAETAALVTITYANGVVAGIDCSWSKPDTSAVWGGLTLDVAGTGGSVSIDFFGAAARGIAAETGLPIESRYGPDFDKAMLRTFVNAVRSGEQPQPDVHVGLRTLSIVLAAQESVATGRTVQVVGETAVVRQAG